MNQRIRINEQGQITETRNVNAIKILGQNRPTADYPAEVIRDADGGGWLIPVYAEIPIGARVTADTWKRVGNEARQTVTAYKTVEQQTAEAAAAAEAQRIETYKAQMIALAPKLDAHPDPMDVVEGGMFYRLPDPADPSILTLWYVRDSDLIAQQLSSHDAAGHSVQRSVNLKTRESVEYSMDEIIKGLKGNKDKAKKTGNVKQATRRRQS